MRPRLLVLLFAALVFAACSSGDDGNINQVPGPDPDPDPDPQFDIDIVRFRVWTLEDGGAEKLRWLGTHEGPLPDSPEQTRWPWVGFGRAFRVDWKAFSRDLPVAGTQYRVAQSEFGPWLPANRGVPYYGDVVDFSFENRTPADELGGEPCPEGPGCEGQVRFESGRYRLQVKAVTTDDRELDESLGVLEFEVNYPPMIELVDDPASGPEDPQASPVAWWNLTDGTIEWVALEEGDTIPSGATVRLRVRGEDRFAANAETDSFCCDDQLDPGAPAVSFQGTTSFVWADAEDDRDTLFTIYGPTSDDPVLTMDVGPFDYTASVRVRDEHGRRGDTAELSFVAGFSPLPPTANLADGATAYLNPDRSPAEGEIQFVKRATVTLAWDPNLRDWIDDLQLTTRLSGSWYEIPLSFRGDPHPRAANVSPVPPETASFYSESYSDHVRSFAYELVHEDDPDNANGEGAGDREDYWVTCDALGELDLTGERTWRIFVPDLLFDQPGLFDPLTGATDEFRDIGARLLELLGRYEFRFRSHTTAPGSVFHQESPQAARDLILDIQRHGRFSEWVARQCAVRIAFTDESGAITGLWPPDTP